MNESGTSTTATPVEERLRAALAARAHSVSPATLRPLRPPTGAVLTRRILLHRTVVGVLVLAAVAALVFFTVRDGPTRPTEPARPPRPTPASRSPVPSPLVPSAPAPSPYASQP
ncbi:hypothetical protein LK07_02420 [Streptomyces pluripotens]|uniref:Uncharacterized protein n=1 Tax=Streptomyces pluripotens TaxID=1355015 RepID=A0A221NSW1_9ACTN|nr:MULTISPECIES: hypothetical protein [Streptomyces]ARP68811.1 hypothetical protein LK06_001330 [Streptomyces pluripotens]ASN23067.1 hypothetical protein LK07_02420 [Streptomyces pluripotens]KIE27795.1 hypothetical protein LK08_05960 [Streptomyces sp. MUSC 125]MCH0558451.1 hypothetical protein [Streptomyces sp. MUM 16J]